MAIGRALLSRPRLLLMDEPLAALDTGRRSEILRLIERVRDECNVRIVYVSHSIGEVSRLADDVVLMIEGAVIAGVGTEEICNRRNEANLNPVKIILFAEQKRPFRHRANLCGFPFADLCQCL